MKKASLIVLLFCIIGSVMVMWVQQLWSSRGFEICGFAMAMLWLGAFVGRQAEPRWSLLLIPPVGAALWSLGQIFLGTTVYSWKTETAILYWSSNAAFFFVALQTFADHQLQRRFIVAMTLFAGALAILSTAQYYTSTSTIFWIFQTDISATLGPIMGPFLNRNQYAAFMEMLLPIALYHALLDRKYGTFYAIAAGVMYASVVGSASRTGTALASAELLAVPLLLAGKGSINLRRTLPALTILMASVAALVMSIGYEDVVARFEQRNLDMSRSEFLAASVSIARQQPWTGIGLGNWATAYPKYATYDNGAFANQAHNDWAQWAAEGGIPMALLMALLALGTIPKAVRSVWGIGVIATFLHCWVDYPIERTGLATLFFVLLAALEYPHSLEQG